MGITKLYSVDIGAGIVCVGTELKKDPGKYFRNLANKILEKVVFPSKRTDLDPYVV